jgi:RNA-binding protein
MIKSQFWNILQKEIQARKCSYEIVRIGNKGLTASVIKEIDLNLKAHELIKIKIQNDDKSVRESMLNEICEALQATAVHHIVLQIIVYRAASEPKIVLPK